ETVVVEADIFTDGHDAVSGILKYCKEGACSWNEIPMQLLGNDRWQGKFKVTEVGRYQYTITAWVDHFKSWRQDLAKRIQPEDITLQFKVGAQLIKVISERAEKKDSQQLRNWANILESESDLHEKLAVALGDEIALLMARYPERQFATDYNK